MSTFYTRGTLGLTQVSVKSQTDPRSGGTTTITAYANSNTPLVAPPDMVNNALYLRANGWSVNIENTQKGNQWLMTATYNADLTLDPTDTWIPEPVWEIDIHEVEKHILECTNRPFINVLSTNTKQLIELAIKHSNPNIQLTSTADIAQLPSAKVAYTLMASNVEGFGMFTKSVKRTLIVSNRYNPMWLDTYDNKVLSKAMLVGTFFVPAVKAVLLPQSDTTIQTDINGVTTFWGYRQYPVSAVSVPPNKTQYSQTWVYDRWSVGDNGGYDVVA